MRAIDVATSRPLGSLFYLRDEKWLIVSPEGHYRGSPRIERDLVYVVQTDEGQEALSPAEFSARFGWKNDPDKVYRFDE